MRYLLIIVGVFLSITMFSKKLKEGIYRGVLILNERNNVELPFNFEVKYKQRKPSIIIRNGDERIVVTEISIKGDSVNFKMPVFDTEFKTVLKGNDLEGTWINNYKTSSNTIRFKATYGEPKRFLFEPGTAEPLFEGKWEVTFSPDSRDLSKAIGLFHHIEQTDLVEGTFLTETGDYRYLEGMKNGKTLFLSCFDGSHAFLFSAEINGDDLVNGKFYSGVSWQENWIGKKNELFSLTNAEEITTIKNRGQKLSFSFPDLNGNLVSLNDKKFDNKAVIIQIMGSWCPNCMDETAYLSEIYQLHSRQGLEIIALAFEKTTEYEKARKQVTRLRDKYSVKYPILITQQTGKDRASELFSIVNKISAFPTTFFLNKKHEIIKIHTGFSGPATGQEYAFFKNNTEALINQLLKE